MRRKKIKRERERATWIKRLLWNIYYRHIYTHTHDSQVQILKWFAATWNINVSMHACEGKMLCECVCVCGIQQPHRAISTMNVMKHCTTSVIKEMKRKENYENRDKNIHVSSISISHSGRARTESFGDVVRCGLVKLICTIRCRNGTPSFAYMRIWQSRNGIWSIWNGLISGAVDFVGNEIGMYFFPLLLYGKYRWRFKNDFWFTDMTVQFHTLRRFVDIMRKKNWLSFIDHHQHQHHHHFSKWKSSKLYIV